MPSKERGSPKKRFIFKMEIDVLQLLLLLLALATRLKSLGYPNAVV